MSQEPKPWTTWSARAKPQGQKAEKIDPGGSGGGQGGRKKPLGEAVKGRTPSQQSPELKEEPQTKKKRNTYNMRDSQKLERGLAPGEKRNHSIPQVPLQRSKNFMVKTGGQTKDHTIGGFGLGLRGRTKQSGGAGGSRSLMINGRAGGRETKKTAKTDTAGGGTFSRKKITGRKTDAARLGQSLQPRVWGKKKKNKQNRGKGIL